MSTQSTPAGFASPFRHAQQRSPWDELLGHMSETEAGGLLVDLQEALNRESRGSAFLLEGRALNGRAAFTTESLKALDASTLRPEDYGRVKVLGAASPFKGDCHSSHPPFPPPPLPPRKRSGRGFRLKLGRALSVGRWHSSLDLRSRGRRCSLCVPGLLAQSPAQGCQLSSLFSDGQRRSNR